MSRFDSCYLIELPGELQNLIFDYLFQDARVTFLEPKTKRSRRRSEAPNYTILRHEINISILATCRLLRQEALPIFWKKFEMFIPSTLLYEFKDTGLWSYPDLHRMIAVRQQVRNISIGARLCGEWDDSIVMLTMMTCFVADLKYYSNLERLTLVSVDGKAMQRSCFSILMEGIYESMSDMERHHLWDHVKSSQRVFGHAPHHIDSPSWHRIWAPVYRLVMSWRADPIKANMFHDTGESPRSPSMTFKIYHQNYEQLHFTLKKGTLPHILDPLAHGYGAVPPLIHEADVCEEVDDAEGWGKHHCVPRDVRLVGEHRAFWQQVDPPRELTDISRESSLLIKYPFWSSESDHFLYVM